MFHKNKESLNLICFPRLMDKGYFGKKTFTKGKLKMLSCMKVWYEYLKMQCISFDQFFSRCASSGRIVADFKGAHSQKPKWPA